MPTGSIWTELASEDLFGFSETGEALLFDPVYEVVERNLSVMNELGLTLAYTQETHVHADHITAAWGVREVVPPLDHRDRPLSRSIFDGKALCFTQIS